MKAKHSYSSQPFLHSNTSQKGLGLFIKCLANKSPVNWQTIAFTASYHNLWESFRPKSILHTSVPTRCHTHSHLKPLTRSATALSHKTFVFTRHFWNHVQPFHPLLASRFFFLFACLLTLTRFFVFCCLTALFSLQDSSLPLQGVSYSRDVCSLHCSPTPIKKYSPHQRLPVNSSPLLLKLCVLNSSLSIRTINLRLLIKKSLMRQGTDTWQHKLCIFALENYSNLRSGYKLLLSPFKSSQPHFFSWYALGVQNLSCSVHSLDTFSLCCKRLFLQCRVGGWGGGCC